VRSGAAIEFTSNQTKLNLLQKSEITENIAKKSLVVTIMIDDEQKKIDEIIVKIDTQLSAFSDSYRSGPDLYFYKKIFDLRANFPDIESFLKNEYNCEILYACLTSWDMNSRGAKMKYFDGFRQNLINCIEHFKKLETIDRQNNPNVNELLQLLTMTYQNLDLMQTNSKLVSNSKLLHYLFPNTLMPMDRENTLVYLFGENARTYESMKRYQEIIEFSYKVINKKDNWTIYHDNRWNTTAPKMVDNAIIMIRDEQKGK
jgi:hypothetical protein